MAALLAGYHAIDASGNIQHYFLTMPAAAFSCTVGSTTMTADEMSSAKRKAMLDLYDAYGDELPFKNLRNTKLYPLLLHWEKDHFVTIRTKPEE